MSILDRIYRFAGGLAAFFMVMIVILTLIQIVSRLFHVQIRDTDILAGFSMAASSFLALAYTLRTGGHIRVTLILSRFKGAPRRILEGWCLLFATISIGGFAWFTFQMVLLSYKYNDLSSGMIGIPLWIPQIAMLLGIVLLEVAFLEECIRFLRGKPLTYDEVDTSDHTE